MAKGKAKVGGDHTTLIDGAAKLVQEASKIPGLSRYAPGFINARSKAKNTPRIIYTQLNAGCLQVKVVTTGGTQEVRFYGDAAYLRSQIEKIWKELHN